MKLLNLTLILWTTIAFATSLPTDTKYTLDDLIKILNGISEDEQLKFLQHHVRLGRRLSIDEDELIDTKPNLPEDFSIYVYNLARKSFRITDEDRLKQLREVICFEDGLCVDIGDPGVHP